jgi:hypothetical protein
MGSEGGPPMIEKKRLKRDASTSDVVETVEERTTMMYRRG